MKKWFNQAFTKREEPEPTYEELIDRVEAELGECSRRQIELREGIAEYEKAIDSMKTEIRLNAEAAVRYQQLKDELERASGAKDA